MVLSIIICSKILSIIFIIIVTEGRSISINDVNPSDIKRFESKFDENMGYWSPISSSIDWCERNYVVTNYIAEFYNCVSSFSMCILAGILLIDGLYNKIEKRFLLMILSFGLVGFGSAYFHGTLTHIGQMFDELPMVYSMIIWWFILFRMNRFKINNKIYSIDLAILFGIFYGFFWTYIHSLQSFVFIFQLHFTLMVLGGIIKLIYLYNQIQYHTHYIIYFILTYVILLIVASICWIIDQRLCEQMNSINGFNPQLHAWWHIICAIDCHIGIVCAQAIRLLSVKYEQYQIKENQSSQQPFNPNDYLRIIFYFGLPFVDYTKDKQIIQTKNQ